VGVFAFVFFWLCATHLYGGHVLYCTGLMFLIELFDRAALIVLVGLDCHLMVC
jgi:hypothetical protein